VAGNTQNACGKGGQACVKCGKTCQADRTCK
jgi:hypothetical protein